MGQVAVDKVPGYKPLILEMRSAPVLVNLGGSYTIEIQTKVPED